MSVLEVQASSVAGFIGSFGINVNIYPSTSGSLVSQLDYLGIDQVRAEAPTSASAAGTFAAIGAAGIRFDLITTCWELPITPTLLNTMFGYIDTVSPYVQSVEGPNEVQNDPDTYQGLSGQAEWTALQTTLYQMVQTDPLLTNAEKTTEVLSFSNVPGGNFTSPLNATDVASVHAYGQPGVLPYDVVNPTLGVTIIAPGKPIIVTESGQTTVPTAQGVSGQEQALYDTDLFLDDDVIGVSKTYLFNLQDFNSSPTDTDFSGWYGLYNSDGSIKPAGTAIHNLTTILADPNASASQITGALAYSLTGLPGDGHQLLLEKSDGTFDLALWAEDNGQYNASTGTLNAAASNLVTVSFGGEVHDVSVFDPITGSSAIETLSAASSLTLSLGADPLIVQISPKVSSATGTSTSGSPPAASALPTLTVGAGADLVALQVSEDQSDGDVLFTVSIDGTQIGGILTTSAIHAAGQDQTVDILGDFTPGEHTVSVDFLNDNGGRNLYVDSTSVNGTIVGGGSHAIYWDGSVGTAFDQPYPVVPTPPPIAIPVTPPIAQPTQPVLTVGAGQDVLAIQVCEDAFQGDAQFTVMVDGHQVGGTLTASASRALGATQTVDVLGNFSGGAHTASVDFLNDFSQHGVGDRNLYVTGATLDGVAVPGSSETLLNTGGKQFSFTSTNPGALTVGSGNDDLSLQVSEDAYQGDAAFAVSVDGSQVGGTLTTTALHDLGQNQTVNVLGSFAAGPHNVTVTFLNDLYAGTTTTDRNLYVDGGSIDGSQLAGIAHTLLSDGSQSSTFTADPIGIQTVGSGSDVLALQVAEDAYQGDAQFTVSVDGTQVGGVLTSTALHDVGQSQTVDVLRDFTAGKHSVSVDFLNDDYKAYSGDRNLYVDGASLDGTAVAGSALKLFSAGAKSLSFIAPPTGSSADAVLLKLSVGSGALTRRTGVSENAYQGGAAFTVPIDDTQVGGNPTASANHTAGQRQLVDVLGALIPGDHTLTLDFLNDANSGIAGGGDRNLNFDYAAGPKAPFGGSSLALLGNSPQSMHFVVAAQH